MPNHAASKADFGAVPSAPTLMGIITGQGHVVIRTILHQIGFLLPIHFASNPQA